jgi:hypothetical protein
VTGAAAFNLIARRLLESFPESGQSHQAISLNVPGQGHIVQIFQALYIVPFEQVLDRFLVGRVDQTIIIVPSSGGPGVKTIRNRFTGCRKFWHDPFYKEHAKKHILSSPLAQCTYPLGI